jgi:hypothetical protein
LAERRLRKVCRRRRRDEDEAVVPSAEQADSEAGRIELLLARDGYEGARVWVERTLNIYRNALGHPVSIATEPYYRWRFERSIREFEAWLSTHPAN